MAISDCCRRARAKRQTVSGASRALLRHLELEVSLLFLARAICAHSADAPAQAPVQEQAAGILSAWAKVWIDYSFSGVLNNNNYFNLI